MSRNRKPLSQQKGNLTVLQQTKRNLEEKSVKTDSDRLEVTPTWVTSKIAKLEYQRLVRELHKIGIVGNLDRDNLGGFCNAYAGYRKATDELNNSTLLIMKPTKFGEVPAKNPLVDVQTNYANEMRKFASLCGLSIDSRLKAAAVKTEKTEDTINKRFSI